MKVLKHEHHSSLLKAATSSEKRTGPNSFGFTLGVGGMAGLLLKGVKHFRRARAKIQYRSRKFHSTLTQRQSLRHIILGYEARHRLAEDTNGNIQPRRMRIQLIRAACRLEDP